MVKMELTKQQRLQLALVLLIIVLLLVIIYPALTVANARFTLKTEVESGATLAERYLLLGDWPSGNENGLLNNFNDFQVKTKSSPNDSIKMSRRTSNALTVGEHSVAPLQPTQQPKKNEERD
ncbi:hypothetical protein L1D32_03155 [Shewanella insulae]|uniref:hypothetical protein n=1 Tax=Shewanella insulae TaxID=2681496 RepID=UPI001EFC3FB7|nr:hypothetical protein [Shewanella insulae]MCG9737156.1 hypothetical protein [Shewanella insulae]